MAHVLLAGCGAIGSYLLPHLARSPHVSRLTVVDRDCYAAENLAGQDIDARHVGQPKALVQARRARRINPRLRARAVHASIDDLPLGALRVALIVACLDSRAARMTVNQAAWRLNVPWIDAGLDAGGLLARVQAFVPTDDAPCLECGWDQADYDALEQAYPCGAPAVAAATGAPSALGALAASMQAIECEKLLGGDMAEALVGRDLLVDARHHRHYVTANRRNPACRMPDHAGWTIAPLGGRCSDTTLADLLAIGGTLRGADESLSLAVAGQPLVTALHCPSCGASHATLAIERHARAAPRRCLHCDGLLMAAGPDVCDQMIAAGVSDEMRHTRLADIGLRAHDVITFQTPAVAVHFELG